MGQAMMAAGRAERARRAYTIQHCEWSEWLTAYRAADRSRYAIERKSDVLSTAKYHDVDILASQFNMMTINHFVAAGKGAKAA